MSLRPDLQILSLKGTGTLRRDTGVENFAQKNQTYFTQGQVGAHSGGG